MRLSCYKNCLQLQIVIQQAAFKRITKLQKVLFSTLKTNAGTRVERNAKRDGVRGRWVGVMCLYTGIRKEGSNRRKYADGELTGD